jgi:hypothetical protein
MGKGKSDPQAPNQTAFVDMRELLAPLARIEGNRVSHHQTRRACSTGQDQRAKGRLAKSHHRTVPPRLRYG